MTERFILIGCLLQGALCSTWSAQMPPNIQALHGSCVLIPCTFQIPSKQENNLKAPVGMWWSNKGAPNAKIVFFSNKTQNDIQGNITGNLFKKNCTTVLNNILMKWTGNFSFRIEGNNPLKYNFNDKVKIDVKDSPPSPQVTINRDIMKEGDSVTLREGDSVTLREGDSVTLTCSAPAPCPSLPPTLSWTPRLSDSVTVFQENDDHTKNGSSVMTFTASHLLHKQEVKCTAVYRLQADNSERTSLTSVTLKVLYSPKNTLVLIGKDGSLTCRSDANPAVNNFTWYKVNGSEIEVVSYTQSLTCNITEVSGQYYCQAQNEHGLQNSSTVQPHCESVKAPPTLIGAVAGAAGIILTCIILTIIIKKSCTTQNHRSKTQETGELTMTNQCENDTPVVYASIEHNRETEQGTGTIRGSSQSTEYAEVNLNTRKEQEGTDMKSEVQEEQEQHVNVLGIDPGPSDKRKETQKPGSGDVSGCGFRAQESTETQKRKTEIAVEQETMEDRKSSGPDDQLNTPEPKEEATYGNICHQLGTKGPDKRSATVEASGNKQQRGASKGQQDDYVIVLEERGTNESEYAVVKKDKIMQ
nr:myelin-associated glycoprotein-like isoform X2 [Paramormyrops kingsleyae]